MTTVWKIEEMERQLDGGGVITAHYRVFATEGETSVSAYGSGSFTPDPQSPDFVPYENLTEEIVLGWVKEQLTDLKVSQIEGQLASVLDQKINPTTSVGRPWVQAEEPAEPEGGEESSTESTEETQP